MKTLKEYEVNKDEIFADLRMEGITHLGLVKTAYKEDGGQISVFYCREDEMTYGLPILPEAEENIITEIKITASYSSPFCGNTLHPPPVKQKECDVCKKKEWILSINEKRVS